MADTNVLSCDDLQRLLDAELAIDGMDVDDVLPRLLEESALVLGEPIVAFRRCRGEWGVEAKSVGCDPPVLLREELDAVIRRSSASSLSDWPSDDGTVWTLLRLSASPPFVIAIRGDWLLSGQRLELWGRTVFAAERAAERSSSARLRTVIHRLSVRLGGASGIADVSNIIVKSMADAVGAELAALAVPGQSDQRLAVTATYGYPLDLVKHVRIQPGEGVIGSTFASGRVLHGKSARDIPGWKPRPRYRSDSFIAVPIRLGREVLGVACVTDPHSGRPFSQRDVSTIRALAAPAALGLSREIALARMREFAHGAAVDPVSGSFNRRYFQVRLEEELQRTRRDRLTLALLMIDIDDFKRVNDSFGHLAGDLVIKDVAEILRRSVRVFDVCARFGGEEFAVLMPASTVESAAKVAGRIRERIENYERPERALQALKITASVGLAVSTQEIVASELVARADDALYQAKREGKNRVRIFSPAPDAALRESL